MEDENYGRFVDDCISLSADFNVYSLSSDDVIMLWGFGLRRLRVTGDLILTGYGDVPEAEMQVALTYLKSMTQRTMIIDVAILSLDDLIE